MLLRDEPLCELGEDADLCEYGVFSQVRDEDDSVDELYFEGRSESLDKRVVELLRHLAFVLLP